MAAWYLAHGDELLLDLDRVGGATPSGGTRIEMFFRRRLRDAVLDGLLSVRAVWYQPSATSGHAHVFVRLTQRMDLMERLIWQSWLGSDLYRARADLMRAQRGHPYPSLLILPAAIAWRAPDQVCSCQGKHDTIEQMETDRPCPVWQKYRGPTPWECFGRPRQRPSEGRRIDTWRAGRVPMQTIMNLREE